jgi:hypothetical protein
MSLGSKGNNKFDGLALTQKAIGLTGRGLWISIETFIQCWHSEAEVRDTRLARGRIGKAKRGRVCANKGRS